MEKLKEENNHIPWWESGSALRKQINSKISGNPKLDWVDHTLNQYYSTRLPLSNCLSIGCGNGETERRLARIGVFKHCDGYESVGEIEIQTAIKEANTVGYDHITYHVVEFDNFDLPPNTYELAYTRDALQHIEDLEHVLYQISQALKSNGLLVLNGYIGPNRFQFSNRQKELSNLCLGLIPERYRMMTPEVATVRHERKPQRQFAWYWRRFKDKLKDGDLWGALQRRLRLIRSKTRGQDLVKTSITFPSPRDVIASDSSLAIRSEEICEVIEQEFVIVEKKDWGGTILQFLLAGITQNFLEEDLQAQAILRMLISIEETLIATGDLTSDFAYIVAKRRRL